MIVWPPKIPCRPQASTWTETAQTNLASFQPEVGGPKHRRRSTASGAIAAGTFFFTRYQLETFTSFFEDETKDGSLPFTWKHPIRDTLYLWCFEGPPEVTEVSRDAYNVAVQLRRLP